MYYTYFCFLFRIYFKNALSFTVYIHTAVGCGARLRSGYGFNVYKLLGCIFFPFCILYFYIYYRHFGFVQVMPTGTSSKFSLDIYQYMDIRITLPHLSHFSNRSYSFIWSQYTIYLHCYVGSRYIIRWINIVISFFFLSVDQFCWWILFVRNSLFYLNYWYSQNI